MENHWRQKGFLEENHGRQNGENLLTNHCRSLHAATPIGFTRSSCKRHYACSQSKKQPWRSHSNAICGDWVAKHNRTTRNGVGNCSSKTGSRRQSEKKTILKHFLKGFLEGKSLAPKWRKSANKSMWQPSCSHSSTIYEIQLQKTIVLPMQPQHEATLTQPFTLRERSYSCKAQWNSIGNSSTCTTCNPIYSEGTILELQITMEFCRPHMHEKQLKPHLQCGTDPRPIRAWSEDDPTTHETVSHPSHRRGRSSTFGDALCMEKHRLSCICYLSKTHFVRDFLQNSIGNSSTCTTCNPICSEGTILELQITMEFHRQLIHQHHLQSHLHCGNDPTVANHNGILSTTHARKTVETPFTMRNRSETNPSMIRGWSDHTRDRLAPVAPQR